MANMWKKYDSKNTYDEYLNSENKLRKQALIISHILERHGIKKLNEIEKNCASTIDSRGINFRVCSSGKKLQEKMKLYRLQVRVQQLQLFHLMLFYMERF